MTEKTGTELMSEATSITRGEALILALERDKRTLRSVLSFALTCAETNTPPETWVDLARDALAKTPPR